MYWKRLKLHGLTCMNELFIISTGCADLDGENETIWQIHVHINDSQWSLDTCPYLLYIHVQNVYAYAIMVYERHNQSSFSDCPTLKNLL